MDNYIKIGKKFKTINKCFMLVLLLAMVAVCFVSIYSWIKFLLILFLIFLYLVSVYFLSAQLLKILTMECNPEKYYAASKVFYKNAVRYEESVAMADLGDFNRALVQLEIVTQTQKGNNLFRTQNKILKIEFLFLSGRYEECLNEISAFKTEMNTVKINENIAKRDLAFCNYYENFINGDYEKCISALDVLEVDKIKKNNSAKHTIEYYYAITYYYSGDIEKAKAYFEKIKDVNESFYYTKKSRQYLESINADTFLALNFDEIPKYENTSADLNAEIKKEKKLTVKAILSLVFLLVIFAGVYFFVSTNTNETGSPQEVIQSAMGFEADVKAILPVENEDAVLCVFQNQEDKDYLYVAYFEELHQGVYAFGIEYDFLAGSDGVYNSVKTFNTIEDAEDLADALHKDEPFKESFDDYEYYFKSGKKDICVVYKIARNQADIPNGVNSQSFVYTAYDGTEKTYYIYISSVEKEKSVVYKSGIVLD